MKNHTTHKGSPFRLVIGLSLLSLVAGCNGSGVETEDELLAEVGGDVLTLEDAREKIPDFMLRQDSLYSLNNYREDWVERKVMLQEAQRLDLDQNPEVRERLARLQEEVLIEALEDHITAREEIEVTDEEARSYYQEHKNQFVLDEEYIRFRHFVGDNLEAAETARQELLNGTSWEDVAREYAVDGERLIEDSEKFYPKSMALNDLEVMNSYLERIGISEISSIRQINGNYHFVQLLDTRSRGEHPDLDWLLGEVKQWLLLEKRRRSFNSYVKNLYLNAESNNEIKIHNVLDTNIHANPNLNDSLEALDNEE